MAKIKDAIFVGRKDIREYLGTVAWRESDSEPGSDQVEERK